MATGSIASLFVNVGADIKGFSAGMAAVDAQTKTMASRMQGMGTKMASAGRTMTLGLTLPIVAGFGLAVKAAAGFQSSLNDMQAASGATAGQMKIVSAAAIKLGNDAKLPAASAADAAEAMTTFAKAGLSLKDTLNATRPALLLATAAQVSNADSADMVASALGMFSLKGKDAAKVVDLFAGAANKSTASMGEISQALNQGGQQAKRYGLSINDTVGALALFANAGLRGSDAGTSFKTMLGNLMAPTGAAAKAVKELGLNFRDSHGDMLPLGAVVTELQSKLGGLTKAQRDAALAAIFGTDSIRAMSILMDAGPAKIAKMTAAVSESGSAQQVADAKMRGFNGALEAFKSSLETAAISVGQVLLPALTNIARGITNVVNWFQGLPGPVKQAIIVLAGVAAVVGPMLFMLGKFISLMGPIKAGVLGIGVALKFLSANPVVLIIAAIAALALGLVYAWKHSETFRNIVKAAFGVVVAIANALKDAFWAVVHALEPLGGVAKAVFHAAAAAVAPFVAAVGLAVSAVRGLMSILPGAGVSTAVAMKSLHQLQSASTVTGGMIVPGVSLAGQNVGKSYSTGVAKGITSGAPAINAAAATATMGGVNAGAAAIRARSPSQTAWEKIGLPLIQGVAKGITDNVGKAKDSIASAMQATIDRGKAVIEAAKATLGTAFSNVAKYAFQAFDDATTVGKDKITAKYDAMFKELDANASRALKGLQSTFDQARSAVGATQAEMTPTEAILANRQSTKDWADQQKAFADAAQALADTQGAQPIKDAQQAKADAMKAGDKAILAAEKELQKALLEVATGGGEQAVTVARGGVKDAVDAKLAAMAEGDKAIAAAQAGNAKDILAAQQSLADAQYAIDTSNLTAQAANERKLKDAAAAADLKNLDQMQGDQQSQMETAFASQKSTVQTAMDTEVRIYDVARQIERDAFDAHLVAMQHKYEAGKVSLATANQQILAMLNTYVPTYAASSGRLGANFALGMWATIPAASYAAGQVNAAALSAAGANQGAFYSSGLAAGNAVAAGLAASANNVSAQAAGLAARLAGPLKLASPAKYGPLSNIDEWWKPVVPMLTAQLDMSGVQSAGMGVASGLQSGVGGGMDRYGGAATNVYVTVTGNTMLGSSSSTTRELARTLQPEIQRLISAGGR